ncbi:MAG: PIG-L family deacetylase [Chloroflexi bacterium]|nr:PIG-L family deacetylase [Chloroflexota bacterium]
MREWYKAIYLSPHLDDAALSCGGQIQQETAVRNPILIVTPMAGEPATDACLSDFAKSLHQRWELARNAVVVRRSEDVVACQMLRADHLHWAIPDCIYRVDSATGEPCYPNWESIITTQHAADEIVLEQIRQQLRQLPPTDQVFAPLTAGNHVDHRLTRLAAEQVFGAKLIYYEDYPYAENREEVTAALTPTAENWHAIQTTLTKTAVRTKINAIWTYSSQINTFFKDRSDLEAKIKDFSTQVGGEQYWQYKSASLYLD